MQEEQKKVSQNSISQAQLSMENSKLTVEQAQENLDMYTLKATISGVVETVNIKEHDFATSSNPAFVISNKDTMTATYYVSEDVRNTFSIGQPITIEKDGKVYDGEVLEIGSAIDAATGLFKVKASVKTLRQPVRTNFSCRIWRLALEGMLLVNRYILRRTINLGSGCDHNPLRSQLPCRLQHI